MKNTTRAHAFTSAEKILLDVNPADYPNGQCRKAAARLSPVCMMFNKLPVASLDLATEKCQQFDSTGHVGDLWLTRTQARLLPLFASLVAARPQTGAGCSCPGCLRLIEFRRFPT